MKEINTMNDSFFTGDPFQAFFKTSERSLVLKADPPRFTILAVSDHYLGLTYKKRSDLLNKGLFEVFPGNDADPSEQHSVYSSFLRVVESKLQDQLPTFKYEIYVPGLGRLDTQYWSNLNEALLDGDGNVAYLVNTTANITRQVFNQKELHEAMEVKAAYLNEQDLNAQLLASNENLALDNAQLGIEQRLLQDLINQLTASEAKVEQAEMTLRQAIEAANVGTWYIHSTDRELRVSNRTKELFGFYAGDMMTLDEFVFQVTDDHRERITLAIEQGILNTGPYDESYPVSGFHDHKIRWLRALGNTSYQPGGFLAFSGVIMDITELKEDELRKNDFISIVSHELKSPLTVVNGFTQILIGKAKTAGDDHVIDTLVKMERQLKKMNGMINGFLDKGRLESGKINLQFTEFNLEVLVNELIDEFRLSILTHMVNIGRCDVVAVFADREKIGNVIANLLSNAVKYSPGGKNIEVNCEILNDRVQLSVKDEGIGISPKDMKGLFERYHRIKTEHTEKIAGFGIGLYLCAEIVRRHKGDIWVKSEPGKGSTFYFNLPFQVNIAGYAAK